MKKRADGRYQKQIFLGYDENHKRQTVTIYATTQKELAQKEAEVRVQKNKGINLNPATSTLGEWSKLFLHSQKLSQSTAMYSVKSYRLKYMVAELGESAKISQIKPFQVKEVLLHIRNENPSTGNPSSDKTVKEYKSTLSQLFKFAKENGGAVSNPCESVTLEKTVKNKKDRRALNSTERKWLEELPDTMQPHKTLVMLAMWSGLRRGEITALTWDDIDLKNKTLNVDKSYDFRNKKVKSPKSENGYRTVPIFPKLEEALKKTPHTGNRIIPGLEEQYLWRKYLVEILEHLDQKYRQEDTGLHQIGDRRNKSIGIEPFGWHELRHTFATILYEADCPLLEAAKILGHDKQMTLNIYTHLNEERHNDTIAKLQEKFKSESSQETA